MKFTYSSASRPLDGYTIKRGIGQGGFGEVYYALSDGGKEVALKLVRGNMDIELRGMQQCLNLKHPNLVALFDIKKDSQSDPWIVMEYVSGESLGAILNRHPRGLPLDMVKQWFAGLARAIGYLHDNGIVHRDLKPGNIFIEQGVVKVGDYGLSKAISASQNNGNGHTQSVGTVHYMAPEISTGNYGKQIDIYAAGVILYEMITGHVPFDGESAGEILMKHLTASPDLSKLPAGYAEVVGRALAKNPAYRYGTMAEMAQAMGQVDLPTAEMPAASPRTRQRVADLPTVVPATISTRTKITELTSSLVLAAVASTLFAILWGALERAVMGHKPSWVDLGSMLYLTVLSSWAVLVPSKLWDQHRGDQWLRRGILLILGLGIGLTAAWLNGWQVDAAVPVEEGRSLTEATFGDFSQESLLSTRILNYLSYYGLAFCLLRWWRLAERTRPRRFSLFPVLVTACLGFLMMPLWPEFARHEIPFVMQGPIVLALAATIVQIVSPWEEPAPRPARRLKLRLA